VGVGERLRSVVMMEVCVPGVHQVCAGELSERMHVSVGEWRGGGGGGRCVL
jgi:hypothetical protein